MASVTYQANYTPQGRLFGLVWRSLLLPGMLLTGMLYVGAPPWLAVAVLLGALWWSLARHIHRGTFTLHDEGLVEELVPFLSRGAVARASRREWRWDQVRHWALEEELTRGLEVRRRLTIVLVAPAWRIRLDEVGDAAQRASYARFVNAFAARARGGALPDPAALPTEIPHALLVPTGDATDPPGAIPRRAAFWDRPAGQAVGLTLILLVVVVAAALILLGGSPSSWFRLVAVLLPGGAWLFWRLYLRR